MQQVLAAQHLFEVAVHGRDQIFDLGLVDLHWFDSTLIGAEIRGAATVAIFVLIFLSSCEIFFIRKLEEVFRPSERPDNGHRTENTMGGSICRSKPFQPSEPFMQEDAASWT